MAKAILAGVGTATLIDGNGDIIATTKTLTESGLNFSLTAEEIRGGESNAILGQYFHDSSFAVQLTDAVFSLEYLALNVGGTIKAESDVTTSEQIVTTVANQITVTDEPKEFLKLGTIGWYKYSNESDDKWRKITFVGKNASVPNLEVGSTVCVKYLKTDSSAREFQVSSAFIPAQCSLILTLPLFKVSSGEQSYTSSSKIGYVEVFVPTFQLDGAQDLSVSASGASTIALNGKALATMDGTEGCDGAGYYGKLKEVVFNKDEFDGVKTIVIANSNIELEAGESETLEVYALYNGATAPRKLDNAKITFTANGSSATVVGGVVTADDSATGVTTIEAVVTGHSTLVAQAVVTVE